ncbi:histone-lysine N-methyltransferase H3 lysine-79 specific-like, partial [Trifolium medium]|nr:histone-lysine N-methyltransferase H3 lysine-79 specific-like [Trifolium medium]
MQPFTTATPASTTTQTLQFPISFPIPTPKIHDSGNFVCPYCSYKRSLKKTRELREKAVRAKNVLSSFLDKGQTVLKDNENRPVEPVKPESVQDHVNRDEHEPKVSGSEKGNEHNDNDNDKDKGEVSVSGSSVSETTKDSDSSICISVKKGRANAKRKVAPVKKSLLPERKAADVGAAGDDGEEEEVTSSRRTISRRKQV